MAGQTFGKTCWGSEWQKALSHIGQHQNVVVHCFITQNTFEERIDRMIQDKRRLADMTVADGESWIGKLSNSEIREILG